MLTVRKTAWHVIREVGRQAGSRGPKLWMNLLKPMKLRHRIFYWKFFQIEIIHSKLKYCTFKLAFRLKHEISNSHNGFEFEILSTMLKCYNSNYCVVFLWPFTFRLNCYSRLLLQSNTYNVAMDPLF